MTKEHRKVRKVLMSLLGTHSQGGLNRNAPALRGVSSNWKKPHHALLNLAGFGLRSVNAKTYVQVSILAFFFRRGQKNATHTPIEPLVPEFHEAEN